MGAGWSPAGFILSLPAEGQPLSPEGHLRQNLSLFLLSYATHRNLMGHVPQITC